MATISAFLHPALDTTGPASAGGSDRGPSTDSGPAPPVTLFFPDGTSQTTSGTATETPAQTAAANQQAALDAQAAQDAANAAAEQARGAANAQEADAYKLAAGIATGNATLEQQATALTQLQQARTVRATTGSQRADVAANGFKEAGTNLNLLRDSMSQGALTDALTGMQGEITAGGYKAQAAASLAESDAASGASAASNILAGQLASAGVLATSQSANLAAGIASSTTSAANGLQFPTSTTGTSGVTGFMVRPSSDPLGTSLGTLTSNTPTPGYDARYTGGVAPSSNTNTSAPAAAANYGPGAGTYNGGGGTGTGGDTIGPPAVSSDSLPFAPASTVTPDYSADPSVF